MTAVVPSGSPTNDKESHIYIGNANPYNPHIKHVYCIVLVFFSLLPLLPSPSPLPPSPPPPPPKVSERYLPVHRGSAKVCPAQQGSVRGSAGGQKAQLQRREDHDGDQRTGRPVLLRPRLPPAVPRQARGERLLQYGPHRMESTRLRHVARGVSTMIHCECSNTHTAHPNTRTHARINSTICAHGDGTREASSAWIRGEGGVTVSRLRKESKKAGIV